MSTARRDLMLAHLARRPLVFLEGKRRLTDELFDSSELDRLFIWTVLCNFYDQFQKLPGREVLEAELTQLLDESSLMAATSQAQSVFDLVSYVYAVDEEELSDRYGLDLIRDFVIERSVSDEIRKIFKRAGDAIPGNISELVEGWKNRLEESQTLDFNPISPLSLQHLKYDAPSEGLKVALPFLAPALDYFQHRQVYGLIGASGAGKTTLSLQLSIEQAKQFAVQTPAPTVYYAVYEGGRVEITCKAMSFAAQIPRTTLMDPAWRTKLSRTGARHQYEEDMFGPGVPEGELERYLCAEKMLENWHLMSMAGDDGSSKCGSGYVEELASWIARDQDARGNPGVGMIFIDYALIMIYRLMDAKGLDYNSHLRHYMSGVGDTCRRLLGERFVCPIWLISQLRGAANRKSPYARHTHADAAESSMFGANLAYCFELGNKNEADGTVRLGNSKARHSAGLGHQIVLRYHNYSKLVLTDMTVDSRTGMAQPAENLSAVGVNGQKRKQQDPGAFRTRARRPV